jgi:hypothetical protein
VARHSLTLTYSTSRFKVTPEIIWGSLHGFLGLAFVTWWQASLTPLSYYFESPIARAALARVHTEWMNCWLTMMMITGNGSIRSSGAQHGQIDDIMGLTGDGRDAVIIADPLWLL